MRLFHTSDWHLGKTLQQQSLLDDQEHILQEFVKAVEYERPDAVIIAGDLYDRPITSTEAINLLDSVLHRIVIELRTPVLTVAGNHDSPSRLRFGNRLMMRAGYHIAGDIDSAFSPVILEDDGGPVHFHLLPFADLGTIRRVLEDDDIRTFDEAYEKVIERIRENVDPAIRQVLVTHAFVTPQGKAEENTSESERPLTVGGSEFVAAERFSFFHYTALGHLHRSGCVMNKKIHYCGSPLKYSISEEKHTKGFLVVEIGADGSVTVEQRYLKHKRDLRTVEGSIYDIERHDRSEDYVFVRLLDTEPVTDAMERVRSTYPNALRVHNDALFREFSLDEEAEATKQQDPLAVFADFYQKIRGRSLPDEARELVECILNGHDQREGSE